MSHILIVGYPYVRERYFATWRHYPESGGVSFLLPRRWSAKDGKVVFTPPTDKNIATTSAYFTHSHYPVIGGLLKGFMPGFVPYLWRHRHEIDLVYSCSEPTLLTTLYQALWTKLLRKKHVCFSWENIPYGDKLHGLSKWAHLILLRMNLTLSDGLVCGNRAGADIHRRYTRCPVAVIPMNGLDPEMFRRTPDDHFSHLSDRTVYSFVGAIGYRKGLSVLVEAFKKVIAEIPRAHLVIAGSGEYEKELHAQIERLGLRERVTKFHWIDHHELVRLLSATDIFVYPSIPHGGWAEQFGYSMAEASLMEVPVIATRSGSIAGVVVDGKTGILVAPGDVSALADAMVRLGRDGALCAQMGQAGRQYIMEHFSHGVVARQFHEFFRRILT